MAADRTHAPRRHPDLPRTHPGELLREETLPALGLSVTAVARHLGVTRQHLHRVLAERAPVSAEMALRLGRFLGNGPDVWLALQRAHDLWHAERASRDALARVPSWRDVAPGGSDPMGDAQAPAAPPPADAPPPARRRRAAAPA